jgi:hypothetical protein
LAVLRPTFFPKRRGVQVMPLLVFSQRDTVQQYNHLLAKPHKSERPGLIFLIFDMYKNLYNFAWRAVLGYFRALKSTENPKMAINPNIFGTPPQMVGYNAHTIQRSQGLL